MFQELVNLVYGTGILDFLTLTRSPPPFLAGGEDELPRREGEMEERGAAAVFRVRSFIYHPEWLWHRRELEGAKAHAGRRHFTASTALSRECTGKCRFSQRSRQRPHWDLFPVHAEVVFPQ